MGFQTNFSIKDLENFSGVKAHTIRIWEKRYDLLKPNRSNTNIRTYDQANLQKLLNVSILLEHGQKISKIAKLSETELYSMVQQAAIDSESDQQYINAFKLSMLNFDQELFDVTYNKLLTMRSFREIFQSTFLNLLDQLGVLWLTNTITPAHEHFITSLIYQKLLLNIERVQGLKNGHGKTFVLFLPMNEIHELGLLYIHFELLLKGHRSIYLGQSVPLENLVELQKVFDEVTFISYFTVEPATIDVMNYVDNLDNIILKERNESFHVLGKNASFLKDYNQSENVFVYDNINALIDKF